MSFVEFVDAELEAGDFVEMEPAADGFVGDVEGLSELVEGSCGEGVMLVSVGEDVIPDGVGVAVGESGPFLEERVFGELGFDEVPGVSSMVGEEGLGEGVGDMLFEVLPPFGWRG